MRLIARLFLPIFTVWLCLFPAMSYAANILAFSPRVVFSTISPAGVASAALDVASLAGRANPWVAALTIGFGVYSLYYDAKRVDGSLAVVKVLPNQVQQSPMVGQTWPGWIQDANGVWLPASVVDPVAVYSGARANGSGLPYLSSFTDACNREISMAGGSVISNTYPSCRYAYPAGSATDYDSPLWESTSCPNGYVLSGALCNLQNSSLVLYPSDFVPTVLAKADGTGFALDARDPDNALLTTIPSTITATGTVNGLSTRTTVEPQTGGGLKIRSEQQVINADGSTSTFRQETTTDAFGKVLDFSSGNYPGSLSQQTSTTTPLAPSTAPAGLINLPTDYNREATQLQIKNNLDAIKTDLDSSQVPADVTSADIVSLDVAKAERLAFKVDIDALPDSASPVPVASLFQPFMPANCEPLTWTFSSVTGGGSHTVIFNLCPWVPMIQRVGSWAMYLLTSAMLFQMFTRRPDGG